MGAVSCPFKSVHVQQVAPFNSAGLRERLPRRHRLPQSPFGQHRVLRCTHAITARIALADAALRPGRGRAGAVRRRALGALGRDDTDEPPFESFTILTHPNQAIPAPLTPGGPVFISGLAQRMWLGGPQLLADVALRIASTPELGAYAVSHAHRDKSRSDYTLVAPRGASEYLVSEPGMAHEDETGDD